jgi:hypothetical protein
LALTPTDPHIGRPANYVERPPLPQGCAPPIRIFGDLRPERLRRCDEALKNFARAASVINRIFMERRPLPGIIWLASFPKSGNTWTRFFLANYLSNPDRPLPINDIQNLNFITHDSPIVHFERFAGKKLGEMSEEEVAEVRGKVHKWLAMSRGRDIFVKTHNMVGISHGFPLIAPEATAGAIYIVRNPLDVSISFAHHFAQTIEKAVTSLCTPEYFMPTAENQIMQHFGSWTQHVNSWTRAPGMVRHVMRYEDMLAKPHETFGAMVTFLGLPSEPERLAKAIEFSSFDELKGQESKGKFKEARKKDDTPFFRGGKAGGWREVLNAEQVKTLIEAHGDAMRRFGYLSDDDEPQDI